jgi:hypothetical protein
MRALGFFAATAPALTFTLLLAAPVQAQDTPRCRSPETAGDRAACEKARQGPEALRRFVQRTQPTLMLHFWDYMSPNEVDRHRAQQQQQRAEQQKPKAG